MLPGIYAPLSLSVDPLVRGASAALAVENIGDDGPVETVVAGGL